MTKFEQLLDYIVNEEHDKANELFHEIVVEKSREIYENLIAQEEEEMDEAADEEMDESADEEMDESADEEMDESADEEMDEAADEEMDEAADEEADESMDLEDSYMMDGGDDMDGDNMGAIGGDAADDLEGDISADSPEEELKMSIEKAMAELQAAFDAAQDLTGGDEGGDEFAAGDDDMGSDDEMSKEDDMMGFMEGRRMTREYVEKVGNDWDKGSNMKQQAKHVGAGSGDTEGAPVEGRSPISSGSGKPNTGANAKNLNQSHHEGGTNTGTSPAGKAGGFLSNAKEDNGGNGNVPGGKMGVKNLKKVSGGHGAEKKGSSPGPVGSGSGDKAGQTSMGNQAQLIKHIK